MQQLLFGFVTAGLLIVMVYGTSSGDDIAGSQDHPMISRYSGSEIIKYKTDKFNDYRLLVKKVTRYGGKDKNLDSATKVEGRVASEHIKKRDIDSMVPERLHRPLPIHSDLTAGRVCL